MSIVQWDETLSVGVREIDAQHKGLLRLINELHDSMAAGRSRETLGEVVSLLKDYAHSHFSTEEKYMRQTGFPGLEEHRLQHESFIAKVRDFEQEISEGRTTPLEVVLFLLDWYVSHVKGVDRQYAGHLQSHGVS
ncbi:MAG: bacteriohemerythrin [Thermodesulfobacteriota bacterium]